MKEVTHEIGYVYVMLCFTLQFIQRVIDITEKLAVTLPQGVMRQLTTL